jgi:TIR domain
MTSHIFISYAPEDERVARAVAKALPDRQFAGWVAEDGIEVGDSLRDRFREELSKASAVVAILSEQSAKNPWVEFELGAALSVGIPIVPVFVGRDEGLPVPEWTRGIRVVDARGKSLREAAFEIAEELAHEGAPV